MCLSKCHITDAHAKKRPVWCSTQESRDHIGHAGDIFPHLSMWKATLGCEVTRELRESGSIVVGTANRGRFVRPTHKRRFGGTAAAGRGLVPGATVRFPTAHSAVR